MAGSLAASGSERGGSGCRSQEVGAGGVVFRRRCGGIEVVVARQRDRYTGERTLRLPKGKLEPGEAPDAAALREVAEETGVRARIVEPLEAVQYRYSHPRRGTVSKRVHFFLMEHQAGQPAPLDGEMEEVVWYPLEAALDGLTYESERGVVRLARERLGGAG